MKYKTEHRYGTLSYDFGYHLSDVEDREVPYTRTGAVYRPDYLRFTLSITTLDAGKAPSAADLEIGTVTLSGKKIKKDGTPGEVQASERVYSYEYSRLPSWVMPLVQYAVKQVQAL